MFWLWRIWEKKMKMNSKRALPTLEEKAEYSLQLRDILYKIDGSASEPFID